MIVSYLRISTLTKGVEQQEYLLDKLGIKFDKKYIDKCTGKSKERPQLIKMMNNLKEGDTLYCESISRFARSLKDLIDIIEALVNKGVRVVLLKEGIDTSTTTYKLLLEIFGAVSEMERDTIKENTIQSIERLKEIKTNTGEVATKSGKWFGRDEKTIEDLPKDFYKYYTKMINKEISKVEMSKLLGCSRATLYRWLKLYE